MSRLRRCTSFNKEAKDRFPLLRKILGALGLSGEAIEDIVELIFDSLSAKDGRATQTRSFSYQVRNDFLSATELSFCRVLRSVVGDRKSRPRSSAALP